TPFDFHVTLLAGGPDFRSLMLKIIINLLDSEIPKPQKTPNFDRFAALFEISPQMARFCVDSGPDSRRSANARASTARLCAVACALARPRRFTGPNSYAHWCSS